LEPVKLSRVAPVTASAPDLVGSLAVGLAGGSARHKYERLHQAREERIDRQWGRLSGVVKFLSDDPQSTRAWARGSEGERRLAAQDTRTILSDARGGVGVDIRDVQQAMASAPHDYSTYWQAQHALPTYHPTTPIPPLKAALATGQSVINGAVRQVNSHINQGNGIVTQAYRLANAANNKNH